MRIIIYKILKGLKNLHSKNICHRDIKLGNIIFELSSDEDDIIDYKITIIDLGLAVKIEPGTYLRDACGTPKFMAPEVAKERHYDFKCDIWSVGVIAHILLCNKAPWNFDGLSGDSIFYKLLNPL